MAEKHKPDPVITAAEPKPRGGLVRLIAVAIFIVAVVIAESLAAYFLLPSASDVAAAAAAKVGQQVNTHEQAEEEEIAEKEETPTIEVDLGNYTISSHQAAANTTLRIDFKLVGAISASDKAQFDELFANSKNRLRDRIIFEIRSADVNDLSDPGLGLIKRRILERVNALLGKPILRSVMFSDFSFVGA